MTCGTERPVNDDDVLRVRKPIPQLVSGLAGAGSRRRRARFGQAYLVRSLLVSRWM